MNRSGRVKGRDTSPRTHFNQMKGFECSCGRSYVNSSNLKEHLRYECGKDPSFKCTECPYMAHRKSNMTAHIRRAHRHATSTS